MGHRVRERERQSPKGREGSARGGDSDRDRCRESQAEAAPPLVPEDPTSVVGVRGLEDLSEQGQRAVEGRQPLLLLAAQLQQDAIQPVRKVCSWSAPTPSGP